MKRKKKKEKRKKKKEKRIINFPTRSHIFMSLDFHRFI
jgi:hypothetical protein